ncbi:MAG TPA: rhodanese-like domain-containing protein [Candidatus Dormibacteraeota bacterium]|nr:rhodanese-like domain-containing protein [Candidatus Dormibacteraeota bacterium]
MRYEDIPATRAADLANRGTQVVDVRERHEFAGGSLPGVINIPLSELPRRIGDLDRERPVAVICQSGQRSRRAAEMLVERDFRQVANVDGGLGAVRSW